MLRQLSIQNYALIDSLEINFSDHFTIITGETGAGKSIFLGALSLILGQRADTKVLQDPDKKCVVEGHVEISAYPVKDFFERNGLDYEDLTILRREIATSGKSRAFINDTPVSLMQLKELGMSLVDIHSQHETLMLNRPEFQMNVVDAFAKTADLLEQYKMIFGKFRKTEQLLQTLREQEKQAKLDQDYWQFQFDELEAAHIKEGEQKELETELEMLNNAETIKSTLDAAVIGLQEMEESPVEKLRGIRVQLDKISRFQPELPELIQRLSGNIIELEDIVSGLESLQEGVQFNSGRGEELSERIGVIFQLQQKHRVQSEEELIRIRNEFEVKLDTIASQGEDIAKLERELSNHRKDLEIIAGKLSEKRGKALPSIEKEVGSLLKNLKMPDARLKIDHTNVNDYSLNGTDKIKFLFSANKNVLPQVVNKMASGGELSRLMLSVKALIARHSSLPTLIFDEIDSGISGEVADKMGSIMREMSGSMQVITITHLPQIASKGKAHYRVEKRISDDSATTVVKKLDDNERINEIARMLSGEKLSDAALKNARSLLAG